jgi:diaminopimelate epimerase
MAPLRFLKMSGAGNDFIVLPEAEAVNAPRREAWVRQLCARGVGVGADGVVLVGEGRGGEPARVRFYNADGGEADFCGNGLRCAARFLALNGAASPLDLVTAWGTVRAEVAEATVRVTLPDVNEEPRRVEPVGHGVVGEAYFLHAGVPHIVVLVQDPEALDVANFGALLRSDTRFGSEGTNVDFVAADAKAPVAIRTFERGVEGETLACGSGAVASALVLFRLRGMASPIRFATRSGSILEVSFASRRDGGYHVALAGEARLVYRGELAEGS